MGNRLKIARIDNDPQGFNYVIEFPAIFLEIMEKAGFDYEEVQFNCDFAMAAFMTDILTGRSKEFYDINGVNMVKKMKEILFYKEVFMELLKLDKEIKKRKQKRR